MRPAIVSVPTRWLAPVFAVALKLTVALPVPLLLLRRVSQAALLAAVQPQPEPAVRAVVEVPPAAAIVLAVGEIANVHDEPDCVTVTVRPATVSVPVRWAVEVLVAALNVTVPFPLPLAPPVTVSQAALLVAVHAHPVPLVTAVVNAPPAEVSVRDVGETVKVQPAPLCVTVTVLPATVSVPTRWAVDVFAVALKVTVPFPLPLAPPVTLSQAALLVAVQAHPGPAVTPVVEEPAAAVSVRAVGETANVQGAEN